MTTTKADNGGLRFNDNKPRFDLIPPEAILALAEHYTVGARKYADRNWERGMDYSKCFASLERHVWAWMSGEDQDEETGSHHMIAAAWNALALFVYHKREIGVDDRPTSKGELNDRPSKEPKGTDDDFSAEDRARAACLGQGPELD